MRSIIRGDARARARGGVRRSAVLAFFLSFSLIASGIALADNVQNDVGSSGNKAMTAGGSSVVGYRIQQNNGDGENGCNATPASPATVTINAPAGVTASPNPVVMTACSSGGTYPYSVTFSSSTVGVHTITVSVSDAGPGTYNTNPATFVLTVNPAPDNTPPVIAASVSGTLGDNGWHTSDVNVSWSVTDPESAIVSSSGCGPTTINADTTSTTLTCTATSAGGMNSQAVTIKRDATPPIISGAPTTSPNENGWYNNDVAVTFSCSDSTSGVASCGPNTTITTEGELQFVNGVAIDNAGNSASATVSDINIDMTAPTASAAASPAPNGNGWNNTDVTVSFSGGDPLSSIDSCSSDVVLSSEGAGQSAGGTCTDKAGNTSAPATASGINIDKTGPLVSASASPAANSNGWNNSTVTVTFNGTDDLSGIDNCDAPVMLSTEGTGQTATGYCTDLAGNAASATQTGIHIDLTAPNVSLVGGPADGGVYYFGFVPAGSTCSASDALSGIDGSCLVSGYGAGVGAHTVAASVSDRAGNSNSASASYAVSGWTLQGFFAPADMGGVLNTVKGGSTVPLKFRVFAGPAELTNTAYIQSLSAATMSCPGANTPVAPVEELAAAGGTVLRYDPDGKQFIYNWKTLKKPGTCYKVKLTTLDGSYIEATFKLT